MIKNLRDLLPGQICESRDHGFYVVLPDGMGRTALFNERGTWGRIDQTEDMFFDDRKKEIVRVYGFTQAMPLLDQISEGIKFVYETRHNTSDLIFVWESEPVEITEAKREIKELKKAKATVDAKLSDCAARIAHYMNY